MDDLTLHDPPIPEPVNTTPNVNCLVGIRCPRCKSTRPFQILVTCFAEVTDEGVEETTDHEWVDGDSCQCLNCHHIAEVKDFHVPEGT